MTFDQAAKNYSEDEATKVKGGFFSDPTTGSSRVPLERIPPDIFFTIDSMQAGVISQPIAYTNSEGKQLVRLIYYKSKTPPHRANMVDDYQKLKLAAEQNKRNEAVKKWFHEVKQDVYLSVDDQYKECKLLEDIF